MPKQPDYAILDLLQSLLSLIFTYVNNNTTQNNTLHTF